MELRTLMRVLTRSGLFIISAAAVGQLITPLSPEVHSFGSPMVLEYTPSKDVFSKGGSVVETGFRNYICRGVTLERVTFQLIRFEKETSRRLRIVSELFNSSGKDKLVSITVELLKGGEVIGTATLKRLRVAPDDFARAGRLQPQGPQTLTVGIPQGADEEPYPKLRVTMEAQDY